MSQSYFKHSPTTEALQPLYAYFLYDKGEFDKVIQYINSIKSNASLRLLLAQAYFRALNYEKSAELMIGLLKEVNIPSEEREEYVINLMATGLNKTLSLEIIQ